MSSLACLLFELEKRLIIIINIAIVANSIYNKMGYIQNGSFILCSPLLNFFLNGKPCIIEFGF